MIKETYNKLKKNILEMNKIQDEINLIEWNTDDEFKCANFDSVEEMKEFERQVLDGEFDFLFTDEFIEYAKENVNIIESFDYTLEDIDFYLYTYKDKNNNFITYMCMSKNEDKDLFDNLYGFKTENKNEAHEYFEKIKNDLCNNTLEYILESIIIDIENNTKKLKDKYNKLVNES